MYDKIILSSLEKCEPAKKRPRNVVLTKEEENVNRYAAGYVPFSLIKRYTKRSSEKASIFIECLSGMAVKGNDESFLKYLIGLIQSVEADVLK